MYSKIINGKRYVTSDGQGIRVPIEFDHPEFNHRAGGIVSNPRLELLIADGWVEWTPPTPEPTPQTEPSFEDKVIALNKMLGAQVVALDDESALEVKALFPAWADHIGEEVQAGWRTYYDEKLYKVVQTHTIQADWTPSLTPALYTEVSVEEWPAWRQPTGAQDAYNTGDKVSHNDIHWVSLVDANVWEPSDAVPTLWSKVVE